MNNIKLTDKQLQHLRYVLSIHEIDPNQTDKEFEADLKLIKQLQKKLGVV